MADTMYKMKPLHQDSKVDLPTCMYPMKSLHNTMESDISDPDMKTLTEKDKKIASDLVSLTEEVKALSHRLGHKFGDQMPAGLQKGSCSLLSGNVKTSELISKLPNGIVDFVISSSVTHPAFSAVLIGEILQLQGTHVAMVTQKHSSLRSDVPDNFLAVTGGLGGRLQHNVEKLVLTFVWKEDLFSPSLMMSPLLQTRIIGDANIGRHLCRILCPQLYDEDNAVVAAGIDKWIDVSVQMSNGSSKEKDAALKSMNSHLGMKDLFCGETITLADVTLLASLLANCSYIKSLPKNVKKWFSSMSSCFKNTLSRFNVPSTWTAL